MMTSSSSFFSSSPLATAIPNYNNNNNTSSSSSYSSLSYSSSWPLRFSSSSSSSSSSFFSFSSPLLVHDSSPCGGRRRCYVTRATPQVKVKQAVDAAMEQLLDDVELRKKKRERNWYQNLDQKVRRGVVVDGPYRHYDETVDLAINLNVDPKSPNQVIRGNVQLPYGTSKEAIYILVITEDEAMAQQALAAGAAAVGGLELIPKLANGTYPSIGKVGRILATHGIYKPLTAVGRYLGPLGLMPSPKRGTVVEPSQLLTTLQKELAGNLVKFQMDSGGIIHLPIGKSSYGKEQLLANTKALFEKIFALRPSYYGKIAKRKKKKKRYHPDGTIVGNPDGDGDGENPDPEEDDVDIQIRELRWQIARQELFKTTKGKRKGKKPNFVLSTYMSSTFGKSHRIDVRTLDPNSVNFMGKFNAESGGDGGDGDGSTNKQGKKKK